MSSMILSFIARMGRKIKYAFMDTVLYSTIEKTYTAFSKAWKNSKIIGFLRKEEREQMAEKSLLYKAIAFDGKVLRRLSEKIGTHLKNAIDNSLILGFIREFLNSALALNSRFLGTALVTFVVVYEILNLNISLLLLAVIVIGFLLILLNRNITCFFKKSKICGFVLSSLGFSDISWDFYEENSAGNKKALISAIFVGAIMGVLPLKLALLLPFAIGGVSLVMMYPITGVFFSVAAAPFVPTMILAGLCILTFISLVIKSLTDKDFTWKMDSLWLWLGLFLLFMLVSCIFSYARIKSLMVWALYLVFIGFYLVIINTIKTKKQLISIIKVFVISGFFVSLYGVLQYVFGWNVTNAWIDEEMFEEATMRVYSTMENPNVLGEYLLLLIPLSAVFMLKASFKKLEKWFYGGVFIISALCLILTQSRGCWLGILLAAVIFVTFYNGRLWSLLPLVILALPFVIPETMVDRLMSIGNLEDSSTSYRVFIWLGTLRMMKDFWLGGIGMGEGAFRSVYPLYSYNAIIAPHSHNTYLQLLVEGGIMALILFIIILIVFLRKMAKVHRLNPKGSTTSLMSLAIGSGVVGFLLQSMFDYTFYNYRMMAMFFMVIALGVKFMSFKEDKVIEDN